MSGSQPLGLDQWHQRYTDQSRWTRDLRCHLFSQIDMKPEDRVLEVGSGTGAILDRLKEETKSQISGVDIDLSGLVFSKKNNPTNFHTQADGHSLPFLDHTFAVSLCHYLLLWVENPAQVLAEMCRVTRPGGCVMALAEPDHRARIDFPPPLDRLGEMQTRALQDQSVDVAMGRQVSQYFYSSGLDNIEVGIIGAQWIDSPELPEDETEWLILQTDLKGQLTEEDLLPYLKLDAKARTRGERILYIPTFYAIGYIPNGSFQVDSACQTGESQL